jgi:hypothetical protein
MSIWHVGILKTAAWLVPKEQRAEWLAEWLGELWQLRDRPTGAALFCLGSFRDAGWLRRNHSGPPRRGLFRLESPARCLLLLAIVAAASLFFALRLPVITASVRDGTRSTRDIFLMLTSIACILLPATTKLALGEYPRYALRRWIFLTCKVGLILPSIYAACIYTRYQSLSHQFFTIPPQILLAAIILTFRWMLNDQRQRCPVCLRLLGNAAHVGQHGRNFIEWNGTELMCARGHGLLHVPATPSDWSGRQRWVDLDPSWSGLFLPRTAKFWSQNR